MTPMPLDAASWLQLLGHMLALSLLAVGGAIGTAPEMHRILVSENGWMTDPQFGASIALSQAAPGPNVLFVALFGWNVGLNAAASAGSAGSGSFATGIWALLGASVCMIGMLLPSTTLTLVATRWTHRNRTRRSVRAFRLGLAPIVVGLVLATAWVLGRANGDPATDWRLWLLSAVCGLLVWQTRMHLLWLLAAGAVLGALGWL